jgi:hypothetical protein
VNDVVAHQLCAYDAELAPANQLGTAGRIVPAICDHWYAVE